MLQLPPLLFMTVVVYDLNIGMVYLYVKNILKYKKKLNMHSMLYYKQVFNLCSCILTENVKNVSNIQIFPGPSPISILSKTSRDFERFSEITMKISDDL